MKINVKVKAGAKAELVEKLADGSFYVRVKEKPREGRANYAVRDALAGYFNVPRSRVTLIRGETSKIKVFEIIC